MRRTVLGPPSCDAHRQGHVIGCLACAMSVADTHDDMACYLDELEHIGWDTTEARQFTKEDRANG